jgi:uncharacterized protein YidB (DUF937 family)
MGLMDDMLGNVLDNIGKGTAGNSSHPMMQMVMNLVQQNGGLAGLVERFGKSGLGQQAASWVGTGNNLPISPEQIGQALGSGPLADLAAKFGIDSSEINSQLARYLPKVVDQLTPQGQIPDDNQLVEQGLAALGGKLFG